MYQNGSSEPSTPTLFNFSGRAPLESSNTKSRRSEASEISPLLHGTARRKAKEEKPPAIERAQNFGSSQLQEEGLSDSDLLRLAAVSPAMPRRQLAEAEVSEIEYAFNAFDFDGSGKIGYFELKEAVRALNLDLQEGKIVAALGEYGKDCYGKICCEEFKEIVSAQYTSRTLEEEVLQAFRVFDLDGSGKVSFRNLRAVTRRLGLHLSDVELRAMLTEFDSDQDGAVDETDFLRIARFGEDELD